MDGPNLQDILAIERTRLSNERTLLSFCRTGLYFLIAGLTINNFVELRYGWLVATGFLVVGVVILVYGIYRFRKLQVRLSHNNMRNNNWQLLLQEED